MRLCIVRWFVPLGLVILLSSSCTSGANESRNTTLAPTTPVSETTTTTASTTTAPTTTTAASTATIAAVADSPYPEARFWNPAVEASVGKPMRIHDMRHTHVGLILAATPQTSPKVIADRLGHEDIRMTLNTYGHLFGGFDEGIADAIGEAFVRTETRSARVTV